MLTFTINRGCLDVYNFGVEISALCRNKESDLIWGECNKRRNEFSGVVLMSVSLTIDSSFIESRLSTVT